MRTEGWTEKPKNPSNPFVMLIATVENSQCHAPPCETHVRQQHGLHVKRPADVFLIWKAVHCLGLRQSAPANSVTWVQEAWLNGSRRPKVKTAVTGRRKSDSRASHADHPRLIHNSGWQESVNAVAGKPHDEREREGGVTDGGV